MRVCLRVCAGSLALQEPSGFDGIAFGVGIYGPQAEWTAKTDLAVTVWGAVLRAMRVVTAARLRDDEPARPMSAVRRGGSSDTIVQKKLV